MEFRLIEYNIDYKLYRRIVDYNYNKLGISGKVPAFVGISFARLISFYPMTDKKEKIYFSLPVRKRIPFLFKYLIKISVDNHISNNIIKKLVDLKYNYDDIKSNKLSDIEFTDRMTMYMILKDYESILDLYLSKNDIRDAYTKLSEFTKVVVDAVIHEKLKLVSHKERVEIHYPSPYGEPPMSMDVVDSISDSIRDDMDKVSGKVSELDKFINAEVERRLHEYLKKEEAEQYLYKSGEKQSFSG